MNGDRQIYDDLRILAEEYEKISRPERFPLSAMQITSFLTAGHFDKIGLDPYNPQSSPFTIKLKNVFGMNHADQIVKLIIGPFQAARKDSVAARKAGLSNVALLPETRDEFKKASQALRSVVEGEAQAASGAAEKISSAAPKEGIVVQAQQVQIIQQTGQTNIAKSNLITREVSEKGEETPGGPFELIISLFWKNKKLRPFIGAIVAIGVLIGLVIWLIGIFWKF